MKWKSEGTFFSMKPVFFKIFIPESKITREEIRLRCSQFKRRNNIGVLKYR